MSTLDVADLKRRRERLFGRGRFIVGYVAIYALPYLADLSYIKPGLRGYEIVRPGVFRDSLARRDPVIVTVDHDPKMTLAKLDESSLWLKEDEIGLRFNLYFLRSELNNEILESVVRGLFAMSFRCDLIQMKPYHPQNFSERAALRGVPTFELLEARLIDISFEIRGANPFAFGCVPKFENRYLSRIKKAVKDFQNGRIDW